MTKPLPFILCSVTMQSRLCALQPGESTAGSLDNTYNNSRYSCTLRKVITRQVWTRWVRRVRPPVSGWPGSLGSSGSPGLDSPDLGSSGTGFTGFGLTGVCYIFTYLYIYFQMYRWFTQWDWLPVPEETVSTASGYRFPAHHADGK